MQENLETIKKQTRDELSDSPIYFEEGTSSNTIRIRLKLVFFVKQGLDGFLGDIIEGLSEEYETKKIIVTEYKQIDEGMLWADICWFEWCDELIAYGSKLELAKEKRILCRLHSYEAFADYIHKVSWDDVNSVIFVAEHIKDNVLSKIGIDKNKVVVIYNGINMDKFKFKERKKGFNIAYVGYINFKKGPMLLLHTFKAIFDKDSRYKLYIAGQFQEERYVLYFQQMIKEMGLQNNVIYNGWQVDINKWLDDKNYILCTSVLEGNPVGVMEGMARGLKPLIHNFVGAKLQFDKYVWNSIDECVEMVISNEFNSKEYKEYIEEKFSLNLQIENLKKVLKISCISLHEKFMLLMKEFKANSDNISNTEMLFDNILDIGDEQAYMSHLSEWFIRSKYDLTSRMKYYYGNIYRRIASYNRFQYIKEDAYKSMEQIGEEFLNKYYSKYNTKFKDITKNNNNQKVLFIVNGLDFNQIVNRIIVEYLKVSSNKNFEYHVLCLLCEDEFNFMKESIDFLDKNNIDYFIPKNHVFEEQMGEFYEYLIDLKPNVIIVQSFYFSPMNVILLPLFRKVSKSIGRFIFQQPEDYFDEKIDFTIHPKLFRNFTKCKKIFYSFLPVDTSLIDKNLDIKQYLKLDKNNKVIISIGRAIKYRNPEFWNVVVTLANEIDNLVFVFFGPSYDNYLNTIIPENLIINRKIILCEVDLNARAYLKSCDFYLNSCPIGGGVTINEAYYAKLPLITAFENREDRYFSAEGCANAMPGVFYDNAKDIFPPVNDYNGMYVFAKNMILNDKFRIFTQNNRSVDSNDLTYEKFVEKLESFIDENLN